MIFSYFFGTIFIFFHFYFYSAPPGFLEYLKTMNKKTKLPGLACRSKIATNKQYSCHSERDEQKFSKETFHTYNTTPASYEDFNQHSRLSNTLRINQNNLIDTHYGLSTNPSQEVHQNKGKRAFASVRREKSSSGTTSPGR